MRNLLLPPYFVFAFLCGCTVNTVPEPVSPSAAVKRFDLEVPEELEVRSADFSATTFSEVAGYGGNTSSSVGGRAFVKVYAVHRRTGEQFLLIYEDVSRRRAPVQIIRFRPTPALSVPDTSASATPNDGCY
jgi:hypothetical protein